MNMEYLTAVIVDTDRHLGDHRISTCAGTRSGGSRCVRIRRPKDVDKADYLDAAEPSRMRD
jgi:hypothetical protein